MAKRNYNLLQKYPLSLFLLLAIVYLSFFKAPSISFTQVKYFDKIIHFVMYFGFCSVLWFEYFLTHCGIAVKRIFVWAIAAPALFSAAIELGQSFLTTYRGGDWADLLFNSLGVVFATLFSVFVIRPIMKRYGLCGKRKWLDE